MSQSEHHAALLAAQMTGDREAEAAALRLFYKKPKPTLLQKFMSRLVFGLSDCWYWNGSIDELGYGRFCVAKKEIGEIKTHRIAWVLFNERPIPDDMMVLHSCDVRCCVNPEHLSLGDQLRNMREMVARGRHKVVPMCGELNPMSRLTNADVLEIRRMADDGKSSHAIAKIFGVAPMTANRIIRRETWKIA